jgi:putative membrane protein
MARTLGRGRLPPMKSFLIKVAVNAVAIWVATLVVNGIDVGGGPDEGVGSTILTFIVIGAIFGLVNAVLKPIVKLLTLPLYILTLGLFTFVVNALMLQVTSWIAEATPLTFHIDAFFWTAILGAVVVTLVSMVLHLLLPDGKD